MNKQIRKLKLLKESRDDLAEATSLQAIRKGCKTKENLMPLLISAVKSDATLGEIIYEMKKEFGEWEENTGF